MSLSYLTLISLTGHFKFFFLNEKEEKLFSLCKDVSLLPINAMSEVINTLKNARLLS